MELQELFDRVVKHLLTQNKRANDDGYSGCKYRTKDGLSCAVGCLIADGHYNTELENHGVLFPEVMAAVEASIGCTLSTKQLVVLNGLQRIHDLYTVVEWPRELKRIATEFGLTYNA